MLDILDYDINNDNSRAILCDLILESYDSLTVFQK